MQQAGRIAFGAECPAVSPQDFPWPLLKPHHIHELHARLARGKSPSTSRQIASVLRAFARELWRQEHFSIEERERACDLRVKGSRALTPIALSRAEAMRLSSLAKERSLRAACIVALCYGSGLRRSEAASLLVDHVDLERSLIEVVGKGGVRRRVGLAAGATEILRCQRSAVDASTLLGCSTTTIYREVHSLGIEAGIVRLTPHALRRAFVSHLLELNVDHGTIAQLCGHKSIATTQLYDRRGEESALKATSRLSV